MKKTMLVMLCGVSLCWQSILFGYDFPVKPGTSEWNRLGTRAERVKALQIPIEQLEKMESMELADACVKYPFFVEIWASDNRLQGLHAIVKEFNGLEELFRRDDVIEILLTLYSQYDPELLNEDWSFFEKGEYAIKGAYVELLLMNSFANENGLTAVRNVLSKAIEYYDKRARTPEIYSLLAGETCAALVGSILLQQSDETLSSLVASNPMFQDFLNTGRTSDLSITSEIIEIAKQFMSR